MILAIETRGELIENRHDGCVAVVDKSGLRWKGGRWNDTYFFRSASKPIQALPVLLLGLDRQYGLTEEETAVMAGSNAGEPYCAGVVKSLMEKTGVGEADLVMNPRYPSHEPSRFAALARGEEPKKLWHGCAPKHVGAILVQRALTGLGTGYHLPDSAAQRLVRHTVALFTDTPYEKIRMGTDGCGVPVFGVPGDKIALSFLRLARPELIPEPTFADAARRMTDLMHRHPRLIRGTDYLCTRMNADPGAVAKGGASGVYAFGLKKAGLGVMLKLYDGTESAWQAVIARILAQVAPEDCPDLLRDLGTKELVGTVCRDIRCMTGEKIGELRAEFTLDRV